MALPVADELAAIVDRERKAGYDAGVAAAQSTVISKRAAGSMLRAQADALTTLSKAVATAAPPAAKTLVDAATALRATATALGG